MMTEQERSEKLIKNALKWLEEHPDYVVTLTHFADTPYPPCREDELHPELWKGGSWKWFLNQMKIPIEQPKKDPMWLQLNKKYDKLKEPRRFLIFFFCIVVPLSIISAFYWPLFFILAGAFIGMRLYYHSKRWKK